MAVEARVPWDSVRPQHRSVAGRWSGREEGRGCVFVLRSGAVAGFVRRTRAEVGEEGPGSRGGAERGGSLGGRRGTGGPQEAKALRV